MTSSSDCPRWPTVRSFFTVDRFNLIVVVSSIIIVSTLYNRYLKDSVLHIYLYIL